VAAVGVGLILLGVGFQILQFIVSILQRNQNRDTTGDPWDGRTLEWSTTSPPPAYNFAVIPRVSQIDEYWHTKHKKAGVTEYESIGVPKNTPVPLALALLAFGFGFGMIWHMYWLVAVCAVAIVATIIVRATADDHERTISAAKIKQMEEATA
jgi:cytochrome o ubiquinol oxidase subunit 1